MDGINIFELFSYARWLDTGVRQRAKDIVKGTPLKGYHTIFLTQLSRGPQTAKELSEAIGVDKGHTSRALGDLLFFGYIEKESDARMARLHLTPEGEKIVENNNRSFRRLSARIKECVTPEDFDAFMRVVRAVGDILREPDEEE